MSPVECVECAKRGCPTEGMTKTCPTCHAIVCFGHQAAHDRREHPSEATAECGGER